MQLKKYSRFSLIFAALIVLMNNNPVHSFAQDNMPQIILTGGPGDQQFISSDNQYYIYSYGSKWVKYDVTSNTQTSSEAFPLSTPLTDTEHQLFGDTLLANVFESPDHRYIVYVTLNKLDSRQKLAIGDRKSLQKHVFEDFDIIFPYDLNGFNVKWSLNSSAFLVKGLTDEGAQDYYAYVSNFTPNISNAWLFDPNDIPDYTLVIQKAYTLTQDGQSALLLSAIGDPDQPTQPTEHRLSIWDSKTPEKIQLLDDIDVSEIINASFVHADDNHLLVATRTDFVDYDLTTHHLQNLQFPFDLTQTELILFAPNGEYLVTTIVTDENTNTYLVPLPLPIKKA